MYKKTAFLVCAMAALISFNNAYAGTTTPHADQGLFEVKSADGNYRLGFSALLQPRLEYQHWKTKDSNKLNFDLNRARFGFYGNVFDPALTFLFQAQFEHDAERKSGLRPKELGYASLTDFSINYAFSQEFFHIAAGKFTVPFARQQVMSPARYQFANALSTNRYFAIAPEEDNIRDIGVMFHNGWNNPLEYALAIVQHGVGARLGYNYNNIDGYDAVDLKGGDFRFGVGVSGYLHRSKIDKNGNLKGDLLSKDFNHINASADFIIKAHGFATNGVFYYNWEKSKEATMGAGLDLGYLMGSFEPVLRYGWYKPVGEQRHEIMGGLNYYAFGHNLKTQLYGGVYLDAQKELNPIIAGLQLQFAL